jgi:hypothetical protein
MSLQNLLQKCAFTYIGFFFHNLFLIMKTLLFESWLYFRLRAKKLVVYDHQNFSFYVWFLFIYLAVDLQYLRFIYLAVYFQYF